MNLQLSRMYFQNAKIKRTIDALYCGVHLLTPKAHKLADSGIAMETKTEKPSQSFLRFMLKNSYLKEHSRY